MTRPCLLLKTGPAVARLWSDASLSARIDCVDQYALRDIELRDYAGLILSMHADQRWIASLADLLQEYLLNGGAIAFNGHIAYPFLPDLRPFVPMKISGVGDFAVETQQDHPVFVGLDPARMNCRRGVAGFWGRGCNPPPEGAVVLQTLGQGTVPVDWIYHPAAGGRLFVHSGNDLWTNFERPEDNMRIAHQLVSWLCDFDAGTGAA